MTTPAAMKRYKKAMIDAEKHLSAAAAALTEMYNAAKAAELPVRGLDDTRVTLKDNCIEYATYLSQVIERRP